MRRHARGHDEHAIEGERAARGQGRVEMTRVDRIERAAEDTDAGAEVIQSRWTPPTRPELRLPARALARDLAPDGFEERVEPLAGGR